MSDVRLDSSWSDLAAQTAADRLPLMIERCREVAALPDPERLDQIEGMVRAEYALDDPLLADFTTSRLRAWLAVESQASGGAETLARGYDAVFNRLPAAMALRRASMVQRIARNVLTPEEVDRLFVLIPSIVQHVPRAGISPVSQSRRAPRIPAVATATVGGGSRPWWKFWGR